MFEGAIIGGAIGFVVAIVMLSNRRRQSSRLVETLESQGVAAARTQLDKQEPARTKIAMTKLIAQRERMAGLALIGDIQALESELAGHTGAHTVVAQVNAIALLGIALRAEPAEAAHRLDALATAMETEGGRAMGLVKKKLRALAILAASLAGGPVPDDALKMIYSFTREGALVALLANRAIAVSLRRAGNAAGADQFDAKVRKHTGIFG